ncbi:MAG: tyrosine-type recombinase/integrase [Acidobacteriota bacterium]|nr:tyrosine-type recombinase/integrase [Acidobacteriota bacterium]
MHALRHTYASLLIAQGENIKYVSRQLGHTKVQITVDTYGHLFEKNSASAMSVLGDAIDKLQREADIAASGLHVAGSI